MTKTDDRIRANDTMPILTECRQIGYDFARRKDGWQLVLTKDITMDVALAHAKSHGLRLDEQGYLLK